MTSGRPGGSPGRENSNDGANPSKPDTYPETERFNLPSQGWGWARFVNWRGAVTDKPTTMIYVHESVFQSWARDLGSFAILTAPIGLGILLDSSAMQWMGFVVALVAFFARVLSVGKSWRLTPQAAADRLRQEFGVVGRMANTKQTADAQAKSQIATEPRTYSGGPMTEGEDG